MKWSTDAPTQPGYYWFFGDFMGGMGQDFTDKATVEPRMVLVEVHKVSNGFMAVAEGRFVPRRVFDKSKRNEGYVGYWAPAELPEPPSDVEAFAGYKMKKLFDN